MSDYTKLLIRYTNSEDSFVVPYTLRNNSIVPKWIERVRTAQDKYPIDDPGRFYGFGSIEEQVEDSLSKINQCIDIINNFEPIIGRRLTNVNDQDTLNYLHHIFEEYHGLLDQQNHEFWSRSPNSVHNALADLNICVHRCESAAEGAPKRHVVTWFGLPKTKQLAPEDYDYFEQTLSTGTVYLNYVEIGKTLGDLTRDNDRYIGDEGFKPFNYYSADFNVKFWSTNGRQATDEYASIREYYANHRMFFEQQGWHWGDKVLTAEYCPLADIDDIRHLDEISNRCWVKSVTFE